MCPDNFVTHVWTVQESEVILSDGGEVMTPHLEDPSQEIVSGLIVRTGSTNVGDRCVKTAPVFRGARGILGSSPRKALTLFARALKPSSIRSSER